VIVCEKGRERPVSILAARVSDYDLIAVAVRHRLGLASYLEQRHTSNGQCDFSEVTAGSSRSALVVNLEVLLSCSFYLYTLLVPFCFTTNTSHHTL
jgi:hypothetical protein